MKTEPVINDDTIILPRKISMYDTMAYLREAHKLLYDENVPRKEVQSIVNKAINELDKIANVADNWESFFFKVANRIH